MTDDEDTPGASGDLLTAAAATVTAAVTEASATAAVATEGAMAAAAAEAAAAAMAATETEPAEAAEGWECGDRVRGKKSCETDAAGERGRALANGASGQDKNISSLPPAGRSFHSAVPFGHRPGLMSEFGGVAGCWLTKPRQATARVADAEVLLGLASQKQAEAPKQAPKLSRNPTLILTNPNANPTLT